MSRKSKRRRLRNAAGSPQAPRPETADGFDFLDDRGADAALPLPVNEPDAAAPPPAPRIESVPARRRDPVPVGSGAADRGATGGHEAGSTAFVGGTTPLAEDATAAVSASAPAPAAVPAAVPAATPAPAAPEPTITIGEILTTTREGRGLTIEEASSRTRISIKMLAHLENDRFGEFAAEAYVRGFLRSYSSFLGLDPQPLLVRYEALQVRTAPAEAPAPALAEPEILEVEEVRPPSPRRAVGRRTKLLLLVAGSALVLAGAGYYLARRGGVELRPAAGLQQIEDELRRAQDSPPTAAVPVPEESVVTPESTSTADAATTDAATVGPPAPEAPPALVGPPKPQPLASHAMPPAIVEDTSPKPPPPAARTSDRRGVDTSRVTDLMEEVPPPAPPAQPPPAPEPPATATVTAPSPLDDGRPLTLTATALDSCVLRVQVDANARAARRHVFTQRGETRSWVARQSFRVLAQPSRNVELRLNGRLVPAPADGRTVVFDRGTLQPAHGPGTPGRTPSAPASPKRTASRATSTAQSGPAADPTP